MTTNTLILIYLCIGLTNIGLIAQNWRINQLEEEIKELKDR